jgi:hypothetical protein
MRLLLASILFFEVLATWVAPVSAQEPGSAQGRLSEQPRLSLAAAAPEQPLFSSSNSDVERQIRTYDRQVFLEILKLAKFNIQYQQTVNHCARWRNVVYPLAQEAGYACFLGYNLTDVSQRGSAWNDPTLISSTTTKRALSSATVGALLGGTSSMVELAANGVETMRANRMGFSPRQSTSFVKSTVKQVDDLLARRHALMEQGQFTGTRLELLQLKEQLLEYERDRPVFEFKRWSVHSRGYAWYKNAFYVINATVNMGRFSAVQLGFKSFTQPGCAGATGPILIASACLAGVGPFASSTIENWVEHYQQRALARKLPVSPFLSDTEDKQKFQRLAQLLASGETSSQHGQLASELVRLREEKLGLDTLIYHEEKTIGRIRLVAWSTGNNGAYDLVIRGWFGHPRHSRLLQKK